MQIEENARFILERLSSLKISLDEVQIQYDKLGGHISSTQNKYNEVGKKIGRFGDQLNNIAIDALPNDEVQKSLSDGYNATYAVKSE